MNLRVDLYCSHFVESTQDQTPEPTPPQCSPKGGNRNFFILIAGLVNFIKIIFGKNMAKYGRPMEFGLGNLVFFTHGKY